MMKKETIQLGKYQAAYTSIGQGIPVILLHGFFGDGSTLNPIIQELKDDYHCLGLDLLGFGDSSKPKINYLIEHQVSFLREFIQAKNLKEFYLIGYSYGAWVAAAYAISQTKLSSVNNLTIDKSENIALVSHEKYHFKKMVLIAPAGIRDDKFVGRYNHLKPLLWESPLVDFSLNIIAPIAKLIGQKKQFNFIREVRQSLINQPVAKAMLTNRLKPEDAVDTVDKNIHKINIPTVVIAGEQDQTIPLWHSQTYANNIPQAALEVIPEADHNLVHTHSKKIGQLIKQYWQK
ncbi:alpha/beta hydrolase [Crocosphaera sp. XPORK-15E]|uniref:alpha/beta fold hydrolase n=1 Tax=Crocosphaera sp. XPORK-15E TaxID=3110247 RepID=UPI002B20614E|nr:alpha/beta hydrolase [Crocosphaera sp. XPORK-15E]MEA5534689.1 alpha/beta hydrolase [Crocosphaera sp. XPORK-15E]